MCDTTSLQLYVYRCPATQVRAVLDVLDERGVELGPGAEHGDPPGLYLGETYCDRSSYGDQPKDLAVELIAAAPDTVFRVWTAPTALWLGCGVIYTPELGQFVYESDPDGEPQFTAAQVFTALTAGPGAVYALLGTAWTDAAASAEAAVGVLADHDRLVPCVADTPVAGPPPQEQVR